MTRSLPIAALLLFTVACNSNKTEPAPEATTVAPVAEAPAPEKHDYGIKATYSTDFGLGDPKLGDVVIALWKQYDDNTLEKGRGYFADSVTMWTDGWKYHGTSDSLMKMVMKMRNTYSANKTVIAAIAPLKANDLNENWVCIWGTEYTTLKGKKDSMDIQENWRFDKNGKIDMMHSYRRKIGK
jgi:hypothetical protein